MKKTNYSNRNKTSLIEIHIAVLLFGLAGLFGKMLSLPSIIIVFGRTCFASLFLFLLLKATKQRILLDKRTDYLYFILMGVVLAVHWVSFFQSIQMSTVAIGLLTFSTFPVFVTFIEPIVFKERMSMKNAASAFIILGGVALIVPEFTFTNSMTKGAAFGVLSGFTFAVLSILNKRYASSYSSLLVAFYQDLTAALVLTPFLVIYKPTFHIRDILLLILLGVVFTGISHSLYIKSLKGIKAQTASIIASLEPVYGIIFSLILLKEVPNIKTLTGGIIILGTVFYSTFKLRREASLE